MTPLIERAAALLGLRRPGEALQVLVQADGDELDSPLYWQVRALALRNLQQPRQALEACAQGLARAPWWAPLHDTAATLHIDLDELAEAERACLRALALDPEDADPWCTYAHACGLAGQLDKAWALLAKAASLEPESVHVASTRVSVAWLTADDRFTERMSRELLARDPQHERGLTMLGLSQALQGRTSQGMATLKGAVLANPRPDGPVQVAEHVRLQAHWAMWPQRLISRLGIGPLWIGVLIMLFALSALDAGGGVFLAVGLAWLLLAVWSWVAPPLVRRALARR